MRKQWSPALLILTLLAFQVALRAKAHASNPDAKPAKLRDGQHDFDFDRQSHQWRLYWANRNGAILQVPTIGQFDNHRGEFFDQEDFQGRSIFVPFLFSDLATTSFRTEQAFSPDGGTTWKPNWTATFTCARE